MTRYAEDRAQLSIDYRHAVIVTGVLFDQTLDRSESKVNSCHYWRASHSAPAKQSRYIETAATHTASLLRRSLYGVWTGLGHAMSRRMQPTSIFSEAADDRPEWWPRC